MPPTRALDLSAHNLIKGFIAWKLLLLVIAAASPGPGYDTSTELVLPESAPLLSAIQRLTRWDAIYFVNTAHRDYRYEQEWAFGWGFTRLISGCMKVLQTSTGISGSATPWLAALVGIAIAHTAHLLSVLTLLDLTLTIFPRGGRAFAFTAAYLHILSPAGLFLSAPYAESSCAFVTFAGILLFAKSFPQRGQSSVGHDLLVLASGVLFGIATTFRSNGILNGLLLLEEALRLALSLTRDFTVSKSRRLLATGVGGLCVAAGFLLPQYIAYTEYCSAPNPGPRRPWCDRTIPSIYTFVQDHYWNAGFLRYWTLSNLPLFLLASPMFLIIIESCIWGINSTPSPASTSRSTSLSSKPSTSSSPTTINITRNLALSQLLLALLTLLNAHVQIITRISSSYPIWIWYLGTLIQEPKIKSGKIFVRFMVLYAVVQGGLFAAFLPPA